MVQFKRLRLSGFKSFVEPTELDIGAGLTGIVGPNGCGKSNLVEALRWVMGENSPKRMRSSGMDDVIFNGTDRRPARNVAEVILSLDNNDRTAPAEINDADELEVSRRIEREVGSVYKVNGKNVRMRDVQLLFADSSIGAHSPALVSQGRIADMINAKPAQRRMVLEEAAGISGLHARRHEAEIKLRAAESNLTRVDDIVGAMGNQLEMLKKQARQATRYRNLSGHIESAEATVLYMRWLQSTAAVQQAQEAFDIAESIVRDKMLLVAEATTAQTESSAHLPQLREEETAAAAALQHLKLAYGTLESEERQVQQERTKAETLASQFTSDLTHEKNQKTEAEAQIQTLQAEQENLERAAGNQVEREQQAQAEKETVENNVHVAESAVTLLTQEIANLDAERNAGQRQVSDLERRLSQAENRKSSLEASHAQLIANTPERAEVEHLSILIAEAETTHTLATTALDQAEEKRSVTESAAQETSDALQAVQRTFNQLSAEAEALKRILKSPQATFTPVLESLTAEAGLEKALAVAFGDDLQAALHSDAPIHWQDLPAYVPPPPLPPGIEPLSRFVQGPPALARALSQIGLAPDYETAVALNRTLTPGQCLVTREGGAWRWDGLTVSADAENTAAVRLRQKNRLAELEQNIAAAQTTLHEARSKADTAKAEKTQAQDAVQTARQAARSTDESLNTLRRRLANLNDQLTQVSAKLAGLTASIQNSKEEIEALKQQLSQAQQSFLTLPDATEKREKMSEEKNILTSLRQKLAEHQAACAEIRRTGEARLRRTHYVAQELTNWNGRLTRAEQRIEELTLRIAQAQEVLSRLSGRPAEIEREKQELNNRISTADAKRQAAATLLTTAETTAAEHQRSLRAYESALSDAREARALAQGNVNTTQQAQATFEAAIMEKFQIIPEELVTKFEIKSEELPSLSDLQSKLDRLIRERDNMGPVNLLAEAEAQDITSKIESMSSEREDLIAAIGKLREGINKLNKEARERLLGAFDTVNGHFQNLFTRLFNGGQAYLKLIEADDPLEAGLEIYAQPPGKKLQVLSLLSGGEQTLTSIALIFGMFLTNPAPICVLDEVDAPLDESNVDRYCTLLEDLAKEGKTRFIVVTHHRMTMARMDRLYGVTMSEKGVSQLVSVDLKQHELPLEAAA